MNAVCPRCGTVTLAGAQTTRFTCKTCHLHFCIECQHWKIDRKQKYCARCNAPFNIPPSIMPWKVSGAVIYIPLGVALGLAIFFPLEFWHIALIVTLPPVIYTSIYLVRFYQRTGLAQAARREAILLGRRALSLATIIYVVMRLGNPSTLTIGLVAAVILILVGLIAQRIDLAVIEELQANRSTWGEFLSMSNWDALLLRFPPARRSTRQST